MTPVQVPIYRAKRIDNGELVDGYYCLSKSGVDLEIEKHNILPFLNLKDFNVANTDYIEINPETLSIHFPDMLDKNGERIFAALNESGIGGSSEKEIEEISQFREDQCVLWMSRTHQLEEVIEKMPKHVAEFEAKFKIQEGLSRLVLSSDDIALSCGIPSGFKDCIIKIYEVEK